MALLVAGVVLAAALGLGIYSRLMHYGPGHVVAIDFSAAPREARSELGLLFRRGDFYLQRCCGHSATRSRGAQIFSIKASDPLVKGSHRSEGRLLSNRLGRRATYRFRLHTPSPWLPSSQRVIVAQWHGTNDFFLAEPGRYPPLEIAIEGNQWVVLKAWDGRLRSVRTSGNAVEGRKVIGEAPFMPGVADWRVETLWSPSGDGRVRAYLNGALVADDNGPNAFRDLVGPYMKFGAYVPDWKGQPPIAADKRSIAFQSVRMEQH